MKIVVKEREYDYQPDYPHGWHHSSDHYYKQPVDIGQYKCFVKRYDLTAEQIPGWSLLANLKGKFEQNLPRVHDIAPAREEGENVYYIFYDYLEGEALYKVVQRNIEVNLEKLTDDLFSAIQSLSKKNYWYDELSDHNIFYDRNRNFFLTDFENAKPVSRFPELNNNTNNTYNALVAAYYHKFLPHQNIQGAHLHGVSHNLLQIMFLVLQLKVYYSNKDFGFNSPDLLNNLPDYLNNISLYVKDIFTKVANNGASVLTTDEVGKIRNLIKEKIVNSLHVPRISANAIEVFTVLNYIDKNSNEFVVEGGKTFTLLWTVNTRSKIELYRNGEPFRSFSANDKEVQLKENYDGKEKRVLYNLQVLTAAGITEKSVAVVVKSALEQDTASIAYFIIKEVAPKDNGEYVIAGNQPVELNWSVRNADRAELYRNGQLHEVINLPQHSFVLKEGYDGKEKKVEYVLRVIKDDYVNSQSVLVNVVAPHAQNPVIHSFEVLKYSSRQGDSYTVENEQPYTLTWSVQNADNIELFKNEQLYKVVANKENSLEISEAGDVTGKSEFTLQVTNGNQVVLKSISVIIKQLDRSSSISASSPTPKSSPIPKPVSGNKPAPAITSFFVENYVKKNGDHYVIDTREPVVFKWALQHADDVELLKNGEKYKKIPSGTDTIEVMEVYADNQPMTRFKLVASVHGGQKAIKELTLVNGPLTPARQVTPGSGSKQKGLLIALIAVVALAATLFFLFRNKSAETAFSPFTGKTISHAQTITLLGSNIPVNDTSLHVTFNNVPAQVIKITADSLLVMVPDLNSNAPVTINAFLKGNRFPIAGNLAYQNNPAALVTVIYPISRSRIFVNDTVIIYGENLPLSAIEVSFNNVVVPLLTQARDSLTVVVPPMEPLNTEISLTAKVNDIVFRIGDHLLYQKSNPVVVSVLPLRKAVIVAKEVVTITGKNFPLGRGAVRINFNGVKGDILTVIKDRILVLVPLLPAGTVKVNVLLSVEGVVYPVAQNIDYLPGKAEQAIKVAVFPLKQSSVAAGDVVNISGENLPLQEGTVDVLFNDIKAKIIRQGSDLLVVQVPTIANDRSVTVTVVVKGANFSLGSVQYKAPVEVAVKTGIAWDQISVTQKYDVKRLFGGIHDLNVTVTNKSPVTLTEAVVEVKYLRKNGKELNTIQLTFENIKPNSSQQKEAPKSEQGMKVITTLLSTNPKKQ